MKTKMLRWLAIILILQSGVLHLADAQAQYQKIPYLGYLAMAYVVGAFITIVLIYFKKWYGWLVGLIVAMVSITVYVLMRLVPLPGLAIEPWLYPYGVIGTAIEGLFILVLVVAQPWNLSPPMGSKSATGRLSFLLPLFGIVFISGVTYGTDRWDSFAYQLGYHHHVGSFSAVCNTPPTSMDDLEREYGVKVSRIAISALGSIVDVRIKVTDPKKAESFLQNQSAILVDQEVLIISPHVHHTHLWRLKKDKVYVAFFSTQRGTVRPGSEVSVVYGTVRVEPVVVQ